MATRQGGHAPRVRNQFDLVGRRVARSGVVWSMKEWEADDALATAAALGSDEVQARSSHPTRTSDRCSTASASSRSIASGARSSRKDDARAPWRGAGEHPDWLALVGDTADGIPGIPGFGEKSSATLLARWGRSRTSPTATRTGT